MDGAVEDLENFVNSEGNAEVKERWKGWIDALKKSENPFTDEVLESLR